MCGLEAKKQRRGRREKASLGSLRTTLHPKRYAKASHAIILNQSQGPYTSLSIQGNAGGGKYRGVVKQNLGSLDSSGILPAQIWLAQDVVL